MIGGMWMWTGEQETICVVFWCVVMDSGNATKPEEMYIFVIRFPNLDTSVSFSLLSPLFTKDHFDFILLFTSNWIAICTYLRLLQVHHDVSGNGRSADCWVLGNAIRFFTSIQGASLFFLPSLACRLWSFAKKTRPCKMYYVICKTVFVHSQRYNSSTLNNVYL